MTELPASIQGPLRHEARRHQPVPVGEVGRDLVDVEDRVDPDDEHPVLPGDVAHSRDPGVAGCQRRREPDVDALRVQVEPGQRHVVLPADQPADAPERRVDDPQRRAVAHAPDGPLGAGRARACGACRRARRRGQVQQRVVDRPPVRLPLLDADRSHTPCSRAVAPRRSVAGPGIDDRVVGEQANHWSSPSQIGRVSIQIGVPGTNASGNTTSWAPCAAAAAVSSATRSIVASRFMRT